MWTKRSLEIEILEILEVGSTVNCKPARANLWDGGLAQLARAPALHAGGHRFDSDILHKAMPWDNYFPRYCKRVVFKYSCYNCPWRPATSSLTYWDNVGRYRRGIYRERVIRNIE